MSRTKTFDDAIALKSAGLNTVHIDCSALETVHTTLLQARKVLCYLA